MLGNYCLMRKIPAPVEKVFFQGTWVAQSGKCPTLDFSSGHDLKVRGFEDRVRLYAEPAWDSLCLPLLSAPPQLMLFLSLKINTLKIFLQIKRYFL